MATVTSATKFFPNVKEGFTTTVGTTFAAGVPGGVITFAGLSGYTDGDLVVVVINPGVPASKDVFVGTKAGNTLTGVICTEGPNTGHSSGETVVDYVTATHWALLMKGLGVSMNPDGTLKTAAVQTALGLTSLNGYTPLGATFNTVVNNGNRSYACTINGTDYTGVLSPGMRVRTTRTVAAPTQATNLNGTTQFWSKSAPAGMTFTDNFTVSAWIKVSSYATGTIVSRYNGSSGWAFVMNSTGTIALNGVNAGTVRNTLSYQSVPLNKWVHVASTITMSTGAGTVYIDGVLVPSTVQSTATSLIQAGNLEVGSQNGGTQPFPGKIAQAAVFSAVLTQATIQSYISQGLAGSEASLISAYNFNGNANDLNTTNANNLTANGSATALNADSPFGGQANGTISSTLDYGIIQSVSFSTNTTVLVQVPEGCTIPTSGGVSTVVYSSNKVPYGFPNQSAKWDVIAQYNTGGNLTAALNTYVNPQNVQLFVPAGDWVLYSKHNNLYAFSAAGAAIGLTAISTSSSVETDPELMSYASAANVFQIGSTATLVKPISLTTQTAYVQISKVTQNTGGGTITIYSTFAGYNILKATNAYL